MVKTAPHFGHLIFWSFDTPAQPNEKTATSANAKNILTHFFIPNHLLSSMDMMPFCSHPRSGDEVLITLLLNFGQALVDGEDGAAFRTLNLLVLRHPGAPQWEYRQQRQCQENADPSLHNLPSPFIEESEGRFFYSIRAPNGYIRNTGNKNPPCCQEKNVTIPKTFPFSIYFFFVADFLVVFLVVFLVPQLFVPQAMSVHLLLPADSTYLST
jgi:hypothetical protein